MWFRETPTVRLYLVLKPAFSCNKRTSKDFPRAMRLFYLSPAPYHPRDILRLKTVGNHQIINSRNVAWKTFSVANEFQRAMNHPG